MISFDFQFRTHYGWVDPMGFLYHAHYVDLFDMGRNELMRSIGMPYAKIEELGVMMPVIDVAIKYKNPAHYDEVITVRTILKEEPTVKCTFYYEVYRLSGELITTANVTVAFMHLDTHHATRCPKFLLDLVHKKFNEVD
ncbi:MAG: thioesterase family protein [Mucinivorans sp.]